MIQVLVENRGFAAVVLSGISDEDNITIEIRGREAAAVEAAEKIAGLFLSSGPGQPRRTPGEEAVRVLVYAGHTSAWMAHRKVALDVHRMLSEDDPDHAVIEAPYTVMALRHVISGVRTAHEHLKTEPAKVLLREALADFDKTVPGRQEGP
ncbi:hypothetical protein ABTX77_32085 [Streptomyces sp. NPDC097704]|uniref:hypothetical protein n=1 Tax=Streptomyces sp. NPDC097704 TaxID=3157101 RepID=UPI00331658F4